MSLSAVFDRRIRCFYSRNATIWYLNLRPTRCYWLHTLTGGGRFWSPNLYIERARESAETSQPTKCQPVAQANFISHSTVAELGRMSELGLGHEDGT